MRKIVNLFFVAVAVMTSAAAYAQKTSGNPIFEGDLTLGHKIQKKPDNWQDSGREIRNEDRIEDIWHRDFGI